MSLPPRIAALLLILAADAGAAEAVVPMHPFTVTKFVDDSADAAQALREVERVARRWNVQVPASGPTGQLGFTVAFHPFGHPISYCLSGTIDPLDTNGLVTGGALTIVREERVARDGESPEVRRSEQSMTLSREQAAVIRHWFAAAGFLAAATRPVLGTEAVFDGSWYYIATTQGAQRLGFVRTLAAAELERFHLELTRFELWTRTR